jgi:hypothetical protein
VELLERKYSGSAITDKEEVSVNRLILSLLFLFVFVPFLEGVDLDPDLSAYLNFDEIDGDVVKDISGNGNDGTLSKNASLDDGKYEKALRFDPGLRVDFDGANFVGTPEEGVTMAAWVHLDAVAGEQELFDCIGTGHDSGLYHFELRSGGAVRWFHRDDSNTQIFNIQTGNVPTGEWAHVAGTYDSGAGEAVLYINGKEIMKSPGAGTLSIDWAVTAGIGQHKGGRQLIGLMDEFYMFKRALDADEIVALMNGELGPFIAVQPEGALTSTWGEIKRRE